MSKPTVAMSSEEFLEWLAKPHPLRWRAYWFILRLLQPFDLKARRREAKYRSQRVKRGWSDQDVWNFDNYLSHVLVGGLTKLRDNNLGHPSGLCDCGEDYMHKNCNGPERWTAILNQMIEGFEAAKDPWGSSPAEEKAREAKLHRSLDLLKVHWFSLWD